MGVNLASERDKKCIERYVHRSRTSSLYHLYEWTEIIEAVFRKKGYYLVSRSASGEVDGVLPFVHIRSLLFGNYCVSVPYFNYGGVCGDSLEIETNLLRQATRVVSELGCDSLELRQERQLKCDLPFKSAKISMRLPLPGNHEDLWSSFPPKLRSQVRRPQKEGMTVNIGRKELLSGFYEVFSRNMKELGTPVYPIRFFRSILDTFPNCTWICTTFLKGIPVASGFLIGFKERLEIPWASSLKAYNRLSPNMLLYWHCLKVACEKGYKIFDFGRSTLGEGTHRFKEQWGATPVQMYWYYWLSESSAMPERNPRNPKYRFAINTWKRLPLSVTRWVGPHIVKNLP